MAVKRLLATLATQGVMGCRCCPVACFCSCPRAPAPATPSSPISGQVPAWNSSPCHSKQLMCSVHARLSHTSSCLKHPVPSHRPWELAEPPSQPQTGVQGTSLLITLHFLIALLRFSGRTANACKAHDAMSSDICTCSSHHGN